MKIFAGGLSWNTDEDSLREVFEAYGEVDSAKVITDRDTGRSRGFGFVEMPNSADGQKAIDELDGAEVDGRNIRVNEAQERRDNGGQRGGHRGGGGYGGGRSGGYNRGGRY